MTHSPRPPLSPQTRADLVVLALTAVWSTTFVVVKDALAQATPFAFLTARFALGAAALALLAGRDLRHGPSLRAGLRLAPLLFGAFACQNSGLALTTPGRSAFLTSLAVLLVPLFSIALLRRWPGRWTGAGILLATGGLVLFTHVLDDAPAAGSTLLGDTISLGGALCFSLHQLLNERYAPQVRTLPTVAVQLALVALISLPLALTESPRLPLTAPVLGAVAFCGLFASAVAISVQTWAQRHTSAVRIALIFTLDPLFATGLSVALGREQLDTASLIGAALMLAGVVVAQAGPLLFTGRNVAPQPERS